jgi:hypothetical protein
MTCDRAMEILMDGDIEASVPFFDHFGARLHSLRCGRCRGERRRMEEALDLMRTGFLPAAPDLSHAVMEAVQMEASRAAAQEMDENVEEIMPLRNWVLAGLCLFASLAVTPLGEAFGWLMRTFGSGLILPIALTLGAVITAFCALFIGSRLDELSERFGLSR